MELDFARYLRLARTNFLEVADQWERPLKRDDLLLNDYLNLVQTLGELMQATDTLNPDVPKPMTSQPVAVVDIYAQGLIQFLMISLKQQWTHLMVLEPADLEKLGKFPQRRLQHQIMGELTMLLNSYHQRRQGDFAHAWRSYLKLGLFELKLTDVEINQAVDRQLHEA